MEMFKCSVCGYVHRGDEAPEKCPKCGVPQDKFVALDEEQVELIDGSRETNEIYMKLFDLLEEVALYCETGLEINLDPGCFKIFNELLKSVDTKQQEIMAEIASHVTKGKWN